MLNGPLEGLNGILVLTLTILIKHFEHENAGSWRAAHERAAIPIAEDVPDQARDVRTVTIGVLAFILEFGVILQEVDLADEAVLKPGLDDLP